VTTHLALDGFAATPGQRAAEDELLHALNRRATGWRVGIAKQSLLTMLISFSIDLSITGPFQYELVEG
jgi:hypothetical protein